MTALKVTKLILSPLEGSFPLKTEHGMSDERIALLNFSGNASWKDRSERSKVGSILTYLSQPNLYVSVPRNATTAFVVVGEGGLSCVVIILDQ